MFVSFEIYQDFEICTLKLEPLKFIFCFFSFENNKVNGGNFMNFYFDGLLLLICFTKQLTICVDNTPVYGDYVYQSRSF